ncbi:MAG: ABC transporter permease [Clostridia bacterium]|nr:ABC transporter permease [Clostridia bacterium]
MFLTNAFRAAGEIIRTNIHHRKQTMAMAGSALKKSYSGALFGWAWALVRPMVFIAVWWFAISVGIRGNAPVVGLRGDEIPYILWMIPGVLAWFLFQETLLKGVSCVRKESHLVTKMVFPIDTIPVFSEISYFVPHLVMLAIALLIFLFSGYGLTVYLLQLLYYVPLFFITCCIVCMFVSILGTISRDFEQMVKALLNVVLWMTPILWQADKMSDTVQKLLKLNPLYYFVIGYRDAFLGEAWFFERPMYTAYILCFILVMGLVTASLQKKLAPEFADVL